MQRLMEVIQQAESLSMGELTNFHPSGHLNGKEELLGLG
jgi:hypothetical protein